MKQPTSEEDFDRERARIMQRIRGAQDWVAGAKEWLETIALDPTSRRSNSMVDALLGLVGFGSDETKARRNLAAAQQELSEACEEWDQFNSR